MRLVHPILFNYELKKPLSHSKISINYECDTDTKWLIKWVLVLTNPSHKTSYKKNIYINAKSNSFNNKVDFFPPPLDNKYVYGALYYKLYNLCLLNNYKKSRKVFNMKVTSCELYSI